MRVSLCFASTSPTSCAHGYVLEYAKPCALSEAKGIVRRSSDTYCALSSIACTFAHRWLRIGLTGSIGQASDSAHQFT